MMMVVEVDAPANNGRVLGRWSEIPKLPAWTLFVNVLLSWPVSIRVNWLYCKDHIQLPLPAYIQSKVDSLNTYLSESEYIKSKLEYIKSKLESLKTDLSEYIQPKLVSLKTYVPEYIKSKLKSLKTYLSSVDLSSLISKYWYILAAASPVFFLICFLVYGSFSRTGFGTVIFTQFIISLMLLLCSIIYAIWFHFLKKIFQVEGNPYIIMFTTYNFLLLYNSISSLVSFLYKCFF